VLEVTEVAACVLRARLQMLSLFNAQERTAGDFVDMVRGSGWKLAEIIPSAPAAMPHLVLVLDEQQ
jgi:hypothetical protein